MERKNKKTGFMFCAKINSGCKFFAPTFLCVSHFMCPIHTQSFNVLFAYSNILGRERRKKKDVATINRRMDEKKNKILVHSGFNRCFLCTKFVLC